MRYFLFASFLLLGTSNIKANPVIDEDTKLEWNFTSRYTAWEEAVDYCELLEGGWRLPNINELISLIHNEESYNIGLSIKPIITNADINGGYWSSTTRPGAANAAYVIWYKHATIFSYPKNNLILRAHVSCVRNTS